MEHIENSAANQLTRIALHQGTSTKEDLHSLKLVFAQDGRLLPNSELLAAYHQLVEGNQVAAVPAFEALIRRRQVRTASGIVPVAVSTAPGGCPFHCIYCPTEANMPKSYLANEPGMMRATRNDFDPRAQIENRLNTLSEIGHATDKVELIVIGGTFTTYPEKYQTDFIKGCFDACNGMIAESLSGAHRRNESAKRRIIGLSIETRPDEVDEVTIRELRRLGITRVEMGVQSTHDNVLQATRRAHTVADTVKATRLLKDAGFKICYHMMPNLPGSDPDSDVEMFHTLFSDSRFQPDMLKIYPTMVVETAELYDWWKDGRYETYDDETLIELLIRIKQIVPSYVRVNRVVREFPAESVVAGTHRSDMRQEIHRRMKARGLACECTRCREIRDRTFHEEEPELIMREYDASDGKEFFISFENEAGALYGLLRLRIPSQVINRRRHFVAELQKAALIRELHTYGVALGVGVTPQHETQHRGLGRRLVREAERIAADMGVVRMAAIAGVGVRPYFRKLGYRLTGTYMTRVINPIAFG